jgi:hypothetical protein
MRDLHNNIDVVEALETIVVNNDTEGKGSGIDLKGYNACEFAVAVGQSGDVLSAGVKLDLKLQHSDTDVDGNYADVAAADILGGLSGAIFATIDDPAEDGVVVQAGYIGSKRFVRVIVDTTGTHTNGTPIGAVAILGRERHTGGQAV